MFIIVNENGFSSGQESGHKAEFKPVTIHEVSFILKVYTLSGSLEHLKISGHSLTIQVRISNYQVSSVTGKLTVDAVIKREDKALDQL